MHAIATTFSMTTDILQFFFSAAVTLAILMQNCIFGDEKYNF